MRGGVGCGGSETADQRRRVMAQDITSCHSGKIIPRGLAASSLADPLREQTFSLFGARAQARASTSRCVARMGATISGFLGRPNVAARIRAAALNVAPDSAGLNQIDGSRRS